MMLWRRLGYLLPWRRRAAERDMQDELRSIAAMARPGELGNLTLAAEDARAEWGWTRLEQTGQDLRYALRTLREGAPVSPPPRCCRWRSASAPTRRSSR